MILFTNEKLCVLNLSQIEFLVATNTDSDLTEVMHNLMQNGPSSSSLLCVYLYNKTGVYCGMHYFSYLCSKT